MHERDVYIVQHWHLLEGGIDSGTVVAIYSDHGKARAFAAKNRAALDSEKNRNGGENATEGYSIVVHAIDSLSTN